MSRSKAKRRRPLVLRRRLARLARAPTEEARAGVFEAGVLADEDDAFTGGDCSLSAFGGVATLGAIIGGCSAEGALRPVRAREERSQLRPSTPTAHPCRETYLAAWPAGPSSLAKGGPEPQSRAGRAEATVAAWLEPRAGPNGRLGERRAPTTCRPAYNVPMRPGGQYVAKACPITHFFGIGPHTRLSWLAPRLSPIMK